MAEVEPVEIAIYFSDKVFYPAAKDILVGLLPTLGVTAVHSWSEGLDRTMPVLCLGSVPDIEPLSYVKTLSQKQIMAFPTALTDVTASVSRLLAPRVWEPLTYAVVDGLTDAEEKAIGPYLVVDIEVGGDVDTDLPEETPLISLAINDGKNIYVFTEESLQADTLDNARVQLLRLFRTRKLIAHNMKFDFRTLSAQFGEEIKGHHDTMIMLHVLNPGSKAKDYNLKDYCIKKLGAEDWESDIKQYTHGGGHYERIPRSILYHYNAYDVLWGWRLFEYFMKGAESEERVAKLALHEFRMTNFYQDVEGNAIAVDVEYLNELHDHYAAEELRVWAELADVTNNVKFNPNSPKQVKEFYWSQGHTDIVSTAVAKLEELELGDGSTAQQFTDLLLEARKITKMKGTYVDGIIKRIHNGLVYPDFLVHGTSTGRLSSRDPNIQNIPRDEDGKVSLRKIFVPRGPDRSLVSVDYSQAELRVMACMSEDPYLISLFQPGMPDFFDSLMPVAFPRTDLSGLDKSTKKNMRANLKGVIYGISYGRKEFAIAKALDMPVQEAKSIIRNYFRAAPKLYDWRMWISEVAIDPDEVLVSPFGRYYQAEVVTGRNKTSVINSGLAFLPQSTASDICVLAAMDVHEKLKGSGALIVATIHDAILIDCSDAQIQWVAELTQAAMKAAAETVFGKVVPFDTEATWGKSWEGI